MKYNPSIDGLRALAVLSVFAFHLNESWLTGGFLGVDIFFTISGFLITGILLKGISGENFSYKDFYLRRIKRILPAYFFMLIGVTIAASIILLPYDYYKFSISAISSIFFLSNINYALRTGDYFSNDASQWLLLHTWSLSVEEQFYVLWPIILGLVFMSKVSQNTKWKLVSITIIGLTIGSIIVATIMASDNNLSKLGYYLVFTRASELLIGALLALYWARNKNFTGFSPIYANAALLVLLACLVFYDKSMPFPSYWVLPPCLATLFLLGGKREGVLHKLLSSSLLVWVGLISYSLYLWHWPIISLARYIFEMGEANPFEIGALEAVLIVPIAFLMAYISYKFIESPVRHAEMSFQKAFLMFFLIPSIFFGLFFGGSILSQGYPERVSSKHINPMKAYFSINKNRCPLLLNLGCNGGAEDAETKVLLVGDSHAEHYFELFHYLGKEMGLSVDLSAGGGCNMTRQSQKCQSIYNYAIEHLNDYDVFIVASRWSENSFAIDSNKRKANDLLLEKLKLSKKPIFMIGRVPQYNLDVNKVANYHRLFGSPKNNLNIKETINIESVNRSVEEYAHDSGIGFIDVYQDLKGSEYSFDVIRENGIPLYLDSQHLSVYGSEDIAIHLLSHMKKDQLLNSYFGI